MVPLCLLRNLLKSDNRNPCGEIWTGIRQFNETHFIGRPGSIPFEPVNAFYPTTFKSFPVVLNQIAFEPCDKLRQYNKARVVHCLLFVWTIWSADQDS